LEIYQIELAPVNFQTFSRQCPVLPDIQPNFGAFVRISIYGSFVQANFGAFVRIFI
jgi:hypothetical protein